MQTSRLLLFSIIVLTVFLWNPLVAQKVGVATTSPQGPFHVASSGQVNTIGGLVILGDTSEGHLELDFDILQSNYSGNPSRLNLQPAGGDLRIGGSLMQMNASNGFVGIGTTTPDQKLELEGSGINFFPCTRPVLAPVVLV
ncbi:MAG: hypothetical protein M3R25_04780 [Bacteroidota bacterium]|nr:hypothetical protein [Bacteroidota bacterium]